MSKLKIAVLEKILSHAENDCRSATYAYEAELAETIKQEVHALVYAIRCCEIAEKLQDTDGIAKILGKWHKKHRHFYVVEENTDSWYWFNIANGLKRKLGGK